ncbi:MAG: signal peptidase I [bacterium]
MEAKLFYAGCVILLVNIILRRFKKRFDNDRWRKIYAEVVEWLDTGFSAIFMAAFIMYFFIQAFKIPSLSMASTLLEGDHLFVNKFVYGTRIPFTEKKILKLKKIKRGDIVIFRYPAKDKDNPHYGKDFIKRALGLPGDKIEIRNKQLFVNGEAVDEKYKQHLDDKTFPAQMPYYDSAEYQKAWEDDKFEKLPYYLIRDNFGPVIVPDNHYFVMGDNRDRSFDSRFWGPLDFKKLRGEALLLYWPLKRIRIIK